MNKLFTKIGVAFAGIAMAVGVGVAVGRDSKAVERVEATEVVGYTLSGLTKGTGTGYNGKTTKNNVETQNEATQDGVLWYTDANVEQSPWRIGGNKNNGLNSAGTVRKLQSQAVVSSQNIKKVVVTTAKPSTSSSAINPTNVSLKVGTSAGGTQTRTLSNGSWAATVTFNRPNGDDWTGKYFEIDFTMPANTGSSNKYITFTSAVFYYESSTPIVSFTNPITRVPVGGTVTSTATGTNTGGATITYSVASASPAGCASVNATTGAVTGNAVGTATIQASATVDNVAYTGTYNISVEEPILNDGDVFKIYANYSNEDYYLSGFASDLGTCSTSEDDGLTFTVVESSNSGRYAFQLANGSYLSYSGSGNNLYTSNTNNSDATLWTIDSDGDDYIIESVNVVGRQLKYNDNGHAGDSTKVNRFACYTGGQTAIRIKKIVVNDPTTLTLNTKSMSLEAESSSEQLTFETDSPDATFSWYSENTSKATVDNGVVTAIANSGTVKIYVWFDTDGSGDFDSSTDLNDYCTVTLTAPVIDYSSTTFGGIGVKITSSNSSTLLSAGKKIIMTYNDSEVAGAYGNYMDANSTSVTFSNSTVTIGDGTSVINTVTILELESATGGFYLKTKDGKYLSNTSTSSSAGNFSKTDNATTVWSVSVDGIYDISNQDNATIMVNTSTTPDRFKPYKTTFTSGEAVVVYSFVEYTDEALAYSEYFITSGGISDNNSCEDTITMWDDLGTYYTNNLTDGAKNIFKNATHNASETYTDAEDYSIQHAVARYDDALLKHTELRSNEFMGRVASGQLSYSIASFNLSSESNNAVTIIVVISIVSLTAVGGYFLLKKKKEQ